MTNWNLIETHTQDGFTINTYVAPETDDPRDQFDDEVVEGIRNGSYVWFQTKIEAIKCGIVLGGAYAGGCCYLREMAFFGSTEWTDMCEDALHDAKQILKDLTETNND